MNLAIDRDKANSVSDLQFSDLEKYTEPWKSAYPKSKIKKVRSIESAVELAKKIAIRENAMHVLITGSLHVVGEALRVLGSEG